MTIALRRFAGSHAYTRQMDTPIRVAHITDQHVGMVTSMARQRAVIEAANAEDPDLVVLTGDFVCHSLDYLAELTELLKGIRSPAMAVLGNHDHYAGADEVRKALRRAGVEVLDNAWTLLDLGHDKILQVVGLDDAYTGNADWKKATHGLDPEKPSLALSHIAEEADRLWTKGIPLVLAGHTHGGQISVGNVHHFHMSALAGHKYIHGLYGDRKGEGAVYVGAGVGAAVIPLRLGDRSKPEVATFDLGVDAAHFDDHHTEQPAHAGRKPSDWLKQRRKGIPGRRRQMREWWGARGE